MAQEHQKPLRILVVDDHSTTRSLMSHLLTQMGHVPVLASNAHEGLTEIENGLPDICFVDWVMPGITGIEFITHIRKLAGGDRCYIVMLSAKCAPGDLAIALEKGVDDFLAKPLAPFEFRWRMQAAVRISTLNRRVLHYVDDLLRVNSSLVDANRQLDAHARTDTVTGLASRARVMEQLEYSWQLAERFSQPLTVVTVNVDHFKKISDKYGPELADSALRHVGAQLRAGMHMTDIVARTQGNSFIIVLPHTDLATAIMDIDHVRLAVEGSRWCINGERVPLTVSMGLAERTSSMSDASALLQLSEKAMYVAKACGRNRVCIPADIRSRAAA